MTYLKTAKLDAVELQWAAQLADFEFDIVHSTGKSNANADALSRRRSIGDVSEQFRVSTRAYGHKTGDTQELHRGCVNRVY